MPYPTEPGPTERTQQHTQKLGAFLALGVAALFIAIVGYFVIFGGRPKPSAPPPNQATLTEPASRPLLATNGVDGQLQSIESARIDLTDKKDPSKRIGQLLFVRMDPLEGHRFAFDKPEAWLDLADGGSVYVRADSGRMYMPDQKQQPESGTLTGHVEIRRYAAREDGKRPDPEKDAALMVFSAGTVSFEAAVGEVVTPANEAWKLTWDGGFAEGIGLSFVFNQPLQRIERAEVRRGGQIVMTSATRDAKKPQTVASKPSESNATQAQPGDPAAPSRKAPVELLYRAIMNDRVTVTQGTRSLDAEKLQLMARLLDGKLPENAIGRIEFVDTAKPAPTTAATPPSSSSASSRSAPPSSTGTSPSHTDPEAMTLVWSGPCVVVPLASGPPELKADHLSLRFSSEQSGRVTLKDDERGLSGHATAIQYGATSRKLSLVGANATDVLLDAPGAGQIEAARLDADLGTGIVTAPGAGTLRSRRQGAADESLTWSTRGEFAFATSGTSLTNMLKMARVDGAVKGGGRGLSFTSDSATAEFDPPTGAGKDPVLRRTVLAGSATAQSSDTGQMRAGKIEVTFDPAKADGKSEPRARRVIADEHVIVERDGATLRGEHLDATLIDLDGRKSDVGQLLARGDVAFESPKDFLSGKTEELRIDQGFDADGARRQIIELVGSGTTIEKNEPGKDHGVLHGTQVRIDARKGRVEGYGAGDFTYEGPTKSTTADIRASWSRHMEFDDREGLIDLWGDAVAHYSPDSDHRNKAEGDRIKLTMTPGNGSGFGTLFGAKDAKPAPSASDREVLSILAVGSVQDREGGTNAAIESRGYGVGEETIRTIHYIEGPSIAADTKAKSLDVPGAGKFLLLDHSPERTPSSAPGQRDLAGGDSRGVSLFTWTGSLHGQTVRDQTTLTMHDRVSVVHRSLKDNAVTEIQCEAITANLRSPEASLGSAGRSTELESVLATGGVYAASGPPKTAQQPRPPVRELIASTLEYDALKRLIEAKAAPGGLVTMFDPTAASPTTASWLSWDMKTDTIQVKNASGTAPSTGK